MIYLNHFNSLVFIISLADLLYTQFDTLTVNFVDTLHDKTSLNTITINYLNYQHKGILFGKIYTHQRFYF